MANKPLTQRIRIEGNNLIIEDCNGTTVSLPIPCTCEAGTSEPAPVIDEVTCTIANALALALVNIWYSLREFTGGQPHNPLGCTVAASQWIATEHLPIAIIDYTTTLIDEQYTAIVSGVNDSFLHIPPTDDFGVLMICLVVEAMAYSGNKIDQSWLTYLIEKIKGQTPDAYITAAGWTAISEMVNVIGLGQWQYYAAVVPGYPPDSGAFYGNVWFSSDCTDCDDPEIPPEVCDESPVINIPEWQGVITPDGWAVDNTADFEDYGDFMTNPPDTSDVVFDPSAERIGLGHWTTIPGFVSNTNPRSGIALIYTPETNICVHRVGFSTLTGTFNTKRLGIYGKVGATWVRLAFVLVPLASSSFNQTLDSGEFPEQSVSAIAFLFWSGGGSPQIGGTWINTVG